ncbi:MFS transporter [Tardisphaera miroshnichenkoae]
MEKREPTRSAYRWVVALAAGIVMTTSFVSLTSFGILSPDIAISMKTSPVLVQEVGVNCFSVGLFAAFLLGHGGIFDKRIREGVMLAQAFLIIPQFLIPFAASLWELGILRFVQGLMIMMLALLSIQLSHWFNRQDRALSLAFSLGAIMLGSALGGILSRFLASYSWRSSYFMTGFIMLLGAIAYFALAKEPGQATQQVEARKGSGIWKHPMTWLMGLVQLPLTWVLFTLGGYLPAFAVHCGYSSSQAGEVITAWGISGFVAAFVGALAGDALCKRRGGTRQEVLFARLKVMSVADLAMGLGALLMFTLGRSSLTILIGAATINGFLMMLPPNYWALPDTVFPPEMVGAGAFAMGLISNSADAFGPVVSSFLSSNWALVFSIMVVISFAGIGINALTASVAKREG